MYYGSIKAQRDERDTEKRKNRNVENKSTLLTLIHQSRNLQLSYADPFGNV